MRESVRKNQGRAEDVSRFVHRKAYSTVNSHTVAFTNEIELEEL